MRVLTVPAFLICLFLTALVAPPCPAAPAVKAFRSKAGRFSVKAPGKPVEQQQAVDTAAGKVMLHTSVFQSGNQAFIASYADYPAATVKSANRTAMLDGVRDGFVSNVQGTLLKERKLTFKTFPGREFRVETGSGLIMLVRVYLVRNRLYQTVAGAAKDKFPEADAKKFLDSFALI